MCLVFFSCFFLNLVGNFKWNSKIIGKDLRGDFFELIVISVFWSKF